MFHKFNTTNLGSYDSENIVANENYLAGIGAYEIALECAQNDMAIFESTIGMDFLEIQSMNEGAEVQLVTEASVSNFIDRLKELAKKAWEKIRGLFSTFLKKFDGVVMRDNKKFVEKYKKEVMSKDLSKMKFKFQKAKGPFEKASNVDNISKEINEAVQDALTASESNIKKYNEILNSGDGLDNILSEAVNGKTTSKEFIKDFHKSLFQEEDEYEGLDSSLLSEIMGYLMDKKLVANIQKENKAVDKLFSVMLKNIDKAKTELSKLMPDGKASGSVKVGDNEAHYGAHFNSKDLVMSRLNLASKSISVAQSGLSRVGSAYLSECKFHIRQCRGVFAKAVSFNPKSVREDAILFDAVQESAEYEINSLFEDYSI